MNAEMRAKSYGVYAELLEKSSKNSATVARDLDLNPTVFSDWKRGKSGPNAEKLIKIADYFNVPITEFLS